mmetsp:Transcript_33203/g.81594  ORF Transcript_33203/g.81594 Transcript_33203/m.81594 type:complete len:287 (-) Transcript_33203:88-948(-)
MRWNAYAICSTNSSSSFFSDMRLYTRSTTPASTSRCALPSLTTAPVKITASSATSSSTAPGFISAAMYSSRPCSWHSSVMSNCGMFRLPSVPSTSTIRSLPASSSLSRYTRSETYGRNLSLMLMSCWLRLRITLNASGSWLRSARWISRSKPRVCSGPAIVSHITSALRWFWVKFTASAISSGAEWRSSTCNRKSRMMGTAAVYVNMDLHLSSMLMWYRSAMLTCWKCGFFISSTTRGIRLCSTVWQGLMRVVPVATLTRGIRDSSSERLRDALRERDSLRDDVIA